jgi:hypothetical protein
MIFDISTKTLFSSDGKILKKLFCPKDIVWNDLEKTSLKIRNCRICQTEVLDTAYLTESQIIQLLATNPNSCIRINIDQTNIKFIDNVVED